ncbi:MAG: uridine kinase [Actinomycetes bacterium]
MADVVPMTPAGAVLAITALISHWPGRVRVAIDAAPAADPHALAASVLAALAPRPGLHIRADRFWQPAGIRFESGREDPDAWLDRWLDAPALRREALDSLVDAGRVLPGLRDPDTDRSLKAAPIDLPETAVLIVSGSALLGRGLPFDISIHVQLSAAALERRTSPDERWIIPALDRYAQRTRPADVADLVLRADDPRHPALVRQP